MMKMRCLAIAMQKAGWVHQLVMLVAVVTLWTPSSAAI